MVRERAFFFWPSPAADSARPFCDVGLRINTYWRSQPSLLFHQREREEKSSIQRKHFPPFYFLLFLFCFCLCGSTANMEESSTVTSLTCQLIRFHLRYTHGYLYWPLDVY